MVLRGSALYQHLVESGFQQADITTNNSVTDTTADADINKSNMKDDVDELHSLKSDESADNIRQRDDLEEGIGGLETVLERINREIEIS